MSVNQYIEQNQDRFLNELFDLLRIPSISADPAYAGDVRKCAETVADHLRKVGAENVVLEETAGYPIVYGEKIIDPAFPMNCGTLPHLNPPFAMVRFMLAGRVTIKDNSSCM